MNNSVLRHIAELALACSLTVFFAPRLIGGELKTIDSFLRSQDDRLLPEGYAFPGKMLKARSLRSIIGFSPAKIKLTGYCLGKCSLDLAPFLPVGRELLRVELGGTPQFSPADKFRLLMPGHPEGSKEYLIALMNSIKVVFSATLDDVKRVRSFKSINFPGYIIRRKGDAFSLLDLNDRLEYLFESRDAGFTWLISRISNIDNPRKKVDCEYDDEDHMVSILLPDNKKYVIKYRDGLPHMIISPYGLTTTLKWADQSWIRNLKTFMLPEHPLHPEYKFKKRGKRRKSRLIRNLRCECDTSGHLLSLINTQGDKYSVEYRSDMDEDAGTKYECAILTTQGEPKRFTSMMFDKNKRTTTFKRGYVNKRADGTENMVSLSESIARRKAHVMTKFRSVRDGVVSEYERNLKTSAITGVKTVGEQTSSVKYDSNGFRDQIIFRGVSIYEKQLNDNFQLSKRVRSNLVEIFKYDNGRLKEKIISSTSNPNNDKSALSHDKSSSYDASENTIKLKYEYGIDGKPAKVTLPNGDCHKFKWDELSRMIRYESPAGMIKRWKYLADFPVPYIVSESEKGGNNNSIKSNITQSFTTTGYVRRIDYPDGTYERVGYRNGFIASFRNRKGEITKYQRTATGRVIRETCGGKWKKLKYDKWGRLIRISYKNGTFEKYKYDKYGRVIKHISRDHSWRAYAYAPDGRKAKIRYSDGRERIILKH